MGQLAHKLKGSALNIGARKLAEVCREIEIRGRSNDGSDCDKMIVSVKEIYGYYKKFGYATEVMGASFRNVGEIQELAGCDLLTISPNLLAELQKSTAPLTRKLSPEIARESKIEKLPLDEKKFRWLFNENAMATEKTSEGIRAFNADAQKLAQFVAAKL